MRFLLLIGPEESSELPKYCGSLKFPLGYIFYFFVRFVHFVRGSYASPIVLVHSTHHHRSNTLGSVFRFADRRCWALLTKFGNLCWRCKPPKGS